MRARLRWIFPVLAVLTLAGATCEAPVKKAPPKDTPPGDPCAADPVVINGDECNWFFQRDAANVTQGGFTTEEASIGTGSLKAGPIGDDPLEKFIAEHGSADGATPLMPVSELASIAYDFLIAGNGSEAESGDRPYLNVYTTFTDPGKFYDCRFDYVPGSGSTTDFTTASFATGATPTHVQNGSGVAPTDCPATLAEMPAGSHLRFFSISVGDTTVSDDELAGFLDNVKVATTSGTTTYDFEPA